MKTLLISLALLISNIVCGQNKLEEKNVIIDSLDHGNLEKEYDRLPVIISGGGEDQKIYKYRFYLNNTLIDSVECTMWRSIGRCKNQDGSYASVSIKHSNFNVGDTLRIESEEDFAQINLRKDYRSLHFSIWGDGYQAKYIRGWGDKAGNLE